MVVLVTYTSQVNENESDLSEFALENAEALADDINPNCPDGCLITVGRCYCYGWYDLESAKWAKPDEMLFMMVRIGRKT